jgi:hypothetical protein
MLSALQVRETAIIAANVKIARLYFDLEIQFFF